MCFNMPNMTSLPSNRRTPVYGRVSSDGDRRSRTWARAEKHVSAAMRLQKKTDRIAADAVLLGLGHPKSQLLYGAAAGSPSANETTPRNIAAGLSALDTRLAL